MLTVHNIQHQLDLMKRVRSAILNDRVKPFLEEFLNGIYHSMENTPKWVREALEYIGYDFFNDPKMG